MSAQYPAWLWVVAAAVLMVSMGMQTRLFMRPEFKARCSACGRLYWRGRTCACSRHDHDHS